MPGLSVELGQHQVVQWVARSGLGTPRLEISQVIVVQPFSRTPSPSEVPGALIRDASDSGHGDGSRRPCVKDFPSPDLDIELCKQS
jgi:hypothetical protein